MFDKKILLESRESDLSRKFGQKFSKDQLDRIIEFIPSKFYLWVAKNLDQINFDQNFDKLKSLLEYFNKFGSNFPKTDINSYENIQELSNAIQTYADKQRRNYKKIHGANLVYDSPRYYVVNPLSSESSCYYGKGTKWCTVGLNSSEHFNRYNSDGKIFYIIDKNLPNSDPNYKIALTKKFDGEESWWDAIDTPIKQSPMFSDPEFKNLISKIDSYFRKEYAGQIKVEEDKKRKKFEEERQRKLEIQRLKLAQRAEAEERRVEQEWALDNNLDEEGQKAWALLYHLENEGATIRDKEQEKRLIEVQKELDDLNNQYNEAPGVDENILDRISELEDEKQEILDLLDVYYFVPKNYSHYGNTQFEVIHDDFYNQSYGVGTEREMQDAAYEYVSNLIDDIGIRGFNESFYESYIDEDAVEDLIRESYEDDVYQNPEVYLDESLRMLSSKQKDEIKNLKFRIESLNEEKNRLEIFSDEIEDEDRLNNLNERIDDIENIIDDLNDEIESIEEDPEGDFPSDLLDDKIEDLVSDQMRDPKGYLEEFGFEIENYIDREKFIEGVIDADGYGQISGYDGNYSIYNVMGTDYYVYRID